MKSNSQYFISGIGTDIGKTIISAILVEKLKANYWKPIQSGSLEETDSMRVKSLISNSKSIFFPESIRLIHPYSPHKAAHLENRELNLLEIIPPKDPSTLICEGAGGLLVPINNHQTNLDLIRYLGYSLILVSKNYLGSINHTLLSISKIKEEKLPLTGIIFVGDYDPYTEDFIAQYSSVRVLGRIPILEKINPESIKKAGENIYLPEV